IIMPAFYLPVILMLLGLVFRGVAFEFRWIAVTSKPHWNFGFTAGSAVAGFCQGLILGGLIQGIKVENGAFAGGAFDWATPFSVLCGFGVLAGYALLGATWLVLKTDGAVAERARAQAKLLLPAVLAFMAAVSLWTPVAFAGWRSLHSGRELLPFVAAIALFLLGYLGLVISSFPYLVPPALTVWQTAAHPASQIFMLLGTAALLPLILAYVVFIYWV